MCHHYPYTYPLIAPTYLVFWALGILAVPAIGIYDSLPFTVRTYRFTAHLTPNPVDLLLTVAFLGLIGLALGLIVWVLLRGSRLCRVIRFILYGNFLLGLALTLLMLFNRPAFDAEIDNYELRFSCEIPISDTLRIREEYFDSRRPEAAGLAYVPIFRGTSYFISHDTGDTWSLFMHIDSWYGDCEDSGIYGEEFFWFWELGTLITTHDGGHTWHMWNAHQLGGEFALYSSSERADSYIESIHFTDEHHGQMRLAYFDHATQIKQTFDLHSTDGGLTWQLD